MRRNTTYKVSRLLSLFRGATYGGLQLEALSRRNKYPHHLGPSWNARVFFLDFAGLRSSTCDRPEHGPLLRPLQVS